MNMTPCAAAIILLLPGVMLLSGGCSAARPSPPDDSRASAAPPPAIQAWMDRLTVSHQYDPGTGFIVARETIALPPLIADAPPLDAAIAAAGTDRLVVAFATADRCAPCQQYKRDALNDAAVIARLADSRLLPTHVEVDRSPELADTHLGSKAIPMTYALRQGKVVAVLRGQRSAADLLAWLDALPE
jgi:hypothetical protein